MKKNIFLLAIILGLINQYTLGQISQGGIPYSFQLRDEKSNKRILSRNIPVIEMRRIDKSTIEGLRESNRKEWGSYQFAYSFDVKIDLKESDY